MNRFDQMRLFFQMMCPVESEIAAAAMADLFDANVSSMIQMGSEAPLAMADAYYKFIFEGTEKPFWFVLSTEGGPEA